MTILLLFFTLFLLIVWYEKRKHLQCLNKIPVRIHINGTRGKSSVARLIAGGLRAHGYNTICKTTGSEASLTLNDQQEIPIRRGCTPNIIEQTKVVEFAAQANADVLIIECMALKPEHQSYSELKLIQSTHGVITNCGPDHLDVMGPTETDVAKALAGSVPCNACLYTNETKHIDIIKQSVIDRHSELKKILLTSSIKDEEMTRFSYLEHKENVALALTLCQDLGVPRQVALKGMWQTQPDLGAMDIRQIRWRGVQLSLVNAFAANDPTSSLLCWQRSIQNFSCHPKQVMLINCRQDRQDRTIQMAKMCRSIEETTQIIVIGEDRSFFQKMAEKHGVNTKSILLPKFQDPSFLADTFASMHEQKLLIVGIGNIKDTAMELLQFFKQQSQSQHPLIQDERSDKIAVSSEVIYG